MRYVLKKAQREGVTYMLNIQQKMSTGKNKTQKNENNY